MMNPDVMNLLSAGMYAELEVRMSNGEYWKLEPVELKPMEVRAMEVIT